MGAWLLEPKWHHPLMVREGTRYSHPPNQTFHSSLLSDIFFDMSSQQLHRFICYSPTHPPKCKCSSRFLVGDEVCAAVPCAHTPAASFAICGFHPLAHLASIIQWPLSEPSSDVYQLRQTNTTFDIVAHALVFLALFAHL